MVNPDRHTLVHIPRIAWAGLGLVVVVPWVALLYVTRGPAPPEPIAARATARAVAPEFTPAQPGPWGELSYFRILIEPPEEYIISEYIRPDPFVWVFKGYLDATLAALWQNAKLTPAQQLQLEDPAHREVRPDAVIIRPERDFVIGLGPAQRATLYAALAEFPENQPQNNPYRMHVNSANGWFTDSGLAPEILALTKRLLYERANNNSVFFSDDDVILPMLSTTAERVKFIKTVSRKSAIMVQLHVPPEANIAAVGQYWSRGRHGKDITPLLQSLARRPGGGTIDIVHLLPTFARSLLNTYPLPSEKPADAARDCHWTSFNFFNDTPDERFTNLDFVRQTLADDYYPVPGEPAFGDILMLVRADGGVVHSCVYLADNFVFTKNGPAFSVPWMLGTLDGVTSLYSMGQPLGVRRYRLKNH